MKSIPQMADAVDDAIAKVPRLKPVRALTKWLVLERSLAAVCGITPFLLVFFDGGEVRESISAYYAMGENQVFYFFLTIASMLFVSNGVLKDGHWYNVALGVLLAGVGRLVSIARVGLPEPPALWLFYLVPELTLPCIIAAAHLWGRRDR